MSPKSEKVKDLRIITSKKALLSPGVPRDAAVNFGTYQSLQRHRAVFTVIAWLSN